MSWAKRLTVELKRHVVIKTLGVTSRLRTGLNSSASISANNCNHWQRPKLELRIKRNKEHEEDSKHTKSRKLYFFIIRSANSLISFSRILNRLRHHLLRRLQAKTRNDDVLDSQKSNNIIKISSSFTSSPSSRACFSAASRALIFFCFSTFFSCFCFAYTLALLSLFFIIDGSITFLLSAVLKLGLPRTSDSISSPSPSPFFLLKPIVLQSIVSSLSLFRWKRRAKERMKTTEIRP